MSQSLGCGKTTCLSLACTTFCNQFSASCHELQAGSSSAPLLEAAYEARDSAQLAALLAATGLLGGLLEETRALG